MKRTGRSGFTLVELLVTIGIVSILFALLSAGFLQALGTARSTICLSNQRQIGLALQLYTNDYGVLPPDGETGGLRYSLFTYIPDAEVFRCPLDKTSGAVDSYLPYYVARDDLDGGKVFTLGCPRHSSGAVLFSDHSATLSRLGRVVANGMEMDLGASAADRTVSSGAILFEDGSKITISANAHLYGVTVLESFRLEDGTLYTVVRLRGNGTAEVSVNVGSKFEIVSPSAIVAVEGTQYTVKTLANGRRTDVTVQEGAVSFRGRGKAKGKGKKVAAGESATIET